MKVVFINIILDIWETRSTKIFGAPFSLALSIDRSGLIGNIYKVYKANTVDDLTIFKYINIYDHEKKKLLLQIFYHLESS